MDGSTSVAPNFLLGEDDHPSSRSYGVDEFASLLGVPIVRAKSWVRRGLIATARGRIGEAAAATFVRNFTSEYDLANVDREWFKFIVMGAPSVRVPKRRKEQ